ncbi:MAG: hypothetical protein V3R83_09995, partial [Gammaproteobacteria bacterium]
MDSRKFWREGLDWSKKAGLLARLVANLLDIHPPRPLSPLKVIKRAARCRRTGHAWVFLYQTASHH